MDANFNRAKEALRVAEDIARFVMDDAILTRRLKRGRHDLSAILLRFPVAYRELVQARNSHHDVGSDAWIQDKGRRNPDVEGLLIANFKRAEEALRVLEEMAKVVSAASAPGFQKLRFTLYELEKSAFRKF